MTNAEAHAINALCRYLLGPLGPVDPSWEKPLTDDQARAALADLADRSFRHLSAGWAARQVLLRWPDGPLVSATVRATAFELAIERDQLRAQLKEEQRKVVELRRIATEQLGVVADLVRDLEAAERGPKEPS